MNESEYIAGILSFVPYNTYFLFCTKCNKVRIILFFRNIITTSIFLSYIFTNSRHTINLLLLLFFK